MSTSGKLVILSGPSCAGKSPLVKALALFHPDLRQRLQSVVLYNSRSPRPGERDGVDYHFRLRSEIEALREKDNFVVLDVRGDLQGLDLSELRRLLEHGDVLFEGNPFVGSLLLTHEKLAKIAKLGAFLAPLSRDEIEHLRSQEGMDLHALVTDVMRRKLLRRMQKQKGLLSQRDLEEIERRAGSAYGELKYAVDFQHVIPNHDGEDSENWSAFYHLLGDARRSLDAFASLLRGQKSPWTESWAGVEL
jgi:guanylate kinase